MITQWPLDWISINDIPDGWYCTIHFRGAVAISNYGYVDEYVHRIKYINTVLSAIPSAKLIESTKNGLPPILHFTSKSDLVLFKLKFTC